MVEVIQHVTIEWHLTLTDREAVWLKAYLQNSMQESESEEEDTKMREAIFSGLHKPKVL